jgi:hypothetical protein
MSWVNALQTGHVTIAAGAAYEESRKPAGFNLTVVDLKNKVGFVHLRTYSAKGRGWHEEIIPRYTDGMGNWALDRVGLINRTREGIADLVARVRNPSQPVAATSTENLKRAHQKNFEELLNRLTEIGSGKRNLIDVATSIGGAAGVPLEKAFIDSVRILSGLSLAPVQDVINIAILGKRLRHTELVYRAPGVNADIKPTEDRMVATIKALCPSARLRNYVVVRSDGTTNVDIFRALDHIADENICKVVISPLSSPPPQFMTYYLQMQYILEELGLIQIVPGLFHTSGEKLPNSHHQDHRIIVKVKETRDLAAMHGAIEFPGVGTAALGVACAFVTGLLSSLNVIGEHYSSATVVRAVHAEAAQREAWQPPSLKRAIELARQEEHRGDYSV